MSIMVQAGGWRDLEGDLPLTYLFEAMVDPRREAGGGGGMPFALSSRGTLASTQVRRLHGRARGARGMA